LSNLNSFLTTTITCRPCPEEGEISYDEEEAEVDEEISYYSEEEDSEG